MILVMALGMVWSMRWALMRWPRVSRSNQATVYPRSVASCASASRKNDLPVPDGPAMTTFSALVRNSRVRR